MNKNTFYLILFLGLVSFVFLVISAFSLLRSPTPDREKSLSPTPTAHPPTPTMTTTEGEIDTHYYDEETERLGAIIQKLPYSGKSFRLTYDYDRFGFDVNIDPENEKVGNLELDSFLKQDGLDRSELIELKVTNFPM